MKVTYYGHSAFQIQGEGVNILFDPFISPNELAKEINISEIKPELILITHGHQDHVADLLPIQQQSHAEVLAIVETASWIAKIGVEPSKIIEMNFGGTYSFGFGKVKMVYALHTNSTPDGNYGGQPVGYILTIGNKKIYFAGDTALTMEMNLLADYQLDWAFLPIGGHYTMDVEDAVKAAKMINCQNIIGMHYNTFPPISIESEAAKNKFKDSGIQLHLMNVGDSKEL